MPTVPHDTATRGTNTPGFHPHSRPNSGTVTRVRSECCFSEPGAKIVILQLANTREGPLGYSDTQRTWRLCGTVIRLPLMVAIMLAARFESPKGWPETGSGLSLKLKGGGRRTATPTTSSKPKHYSPGH